MGLKQMRQRLGWRLGSPAARALVLPAERALTKLLNSRENGQKRPVKARPQL